VAQKNSYAEGTEPKRDGAVRESPSNTRKAANPGANVKMGQAILGTKTPRGERHDEKTGNAVIRSGCHNDAGPKSFRIYHPLGD
jgi:cytochrome c